MTVSCPMSTGKGSGNDDAPKVPLWRKLMSMHKVRLSTAKRTARQHARMMVEDRRRAVGMKTVRAVQTENRIVCHEKELHRQTTVFKKGMQTSTYSPISAAESSLINPTSLANATEVFTANQLHLKVQYARNLIDLDLGGWECSPFCKVGVGEVGMRTNHITGTCNPDWNETFTFSGKAVIEAGFVALFEVWSTNNVLRPNAFMGQAELDLRAISLGTLSNRLTCTMKLYVLKTSGKKDRRDYGEVTVNMWTSPQEEDGRQVLSPGGNATASKDLMSSLLKCKTLPALFHSSCGTLYEEPCIVFIRIAIQEILLPVTSTAKSAVASRSKAKRSALSKSQSVGSRSLKSNSDYSRTDSKACSGFTAGFASYFRRTFTIGSMRSTESQEYQADDVSDYGDFENDLTFDAGIYADSDNEVSAEVIPATAATTDKTAPDASSSKPRRALKFWVYCELKYAKQMHTSRLRRVNPDTNIAQVDQSFVFSEVRPLYRRAPVQISVFMTSSKMARGVLVGKKTVCMLALLMVHEMADKEHEAECDLPSSVPRKYKHFIKARTVAPIFHLPVLDWSLDDKANGGTMVMHVGAADMDYRPQMYDVPLIPRVITLELSKMGANKICPLLAAKLLKAPEQPAGPEPDAHHRENLSSTINSIRQSAEDIMRRATLPSTSRLLGHAGGSGRQAKRAAGSPSQAGARSLPQIQEEAHEGEQQTQGVENTILGLKTATSNTLGWSDSTSFQLLLKKHSIEAMNQRSSSNASDLSVGDVNGSSSSSAVSAVARWLKSYSSRHVIEAQDTAAGDNAKPKTPSLLSRLLAWLWGLWICIQSAFSEKCACIKDRLKTRRCGGKVLLEEDALEVVDIRPRFMGCGRGRLLRRCGGGRFDQTLLEGIDMSLGLEDTTFVTPASSPRHDSSAPTYGAAPSLSPAPSSVTTSSAAPTHGTAPSVASDSHKIFEPSTVASLLGLSEDDLRASTLQPATTLPIGSLSLIYKRVTLTIPNVYYFIVFKVGPQWVKTNTRKSLDDSPPNWELRVPVYEPSDSYMAYIFYSKSPNPSPSDIKVFSQAKFPLSSMTPNREVVRELRIMMDPGGGVQSAPSKKYFVEVKIQFTLLYPDWGDLALSYKRPQHPAQWYALNMDEHDAYIQKRYRKIIQRWLEQSNPPLPALCVKHMLKSPREKFDFDLLMGNVKRVWKSISGIMALADSLEYIMSWENPYVSAFTIIVLGALCINPAVAIALGLAWMILVTHGRRPTVDNVPGSLYKDVDEESDDDVEAPATNRMGAIKRQYDGLIRVALLVQNLLDDLATTFERIGSLMAWQDPVATMIFMSVLAAVSLAFYLLGMSVLLVLVVAYVLRPPQFRDPEPTPPESFFARLHARRDITMSFSKVQDVGTGVVRPEGPQNKSVK